MKFNFNLKYGIFICLFIFAIYFCFTLNNVYNQSKEINCITYYTSLGYTANGCEKYIESFLGDIDD